MYKEGDVTVLPLPTNRYHVACWHTLGFVIGWERHLQLLRSCLRDVDAFYYLIHPADLMDMSDLNPIKKLPFEPRGPSLEERQKRLKEAIEVILESGREIVTMRELAVRNAP